MAKETSRRDALIFNLWYIQKMSFQQIAELPLPSTLSIKRIRNIVYAGLKADRSPHEKEIYTRFRLKFLEIQDVAETIRYVHANQPPRKYKSWIIQHVVRKELKKRNKEFVK
jgi:hypothetical protein